MAEFILSYEKYINNNGDELNEGWKTWLSTFMLLLNLGIVPPKIQAADLNTKIEWVQSIPKGTVDLAKFAAFLTRDSKTDIDEKDDVISKIEEFNKLNGTNLNYDMVKTYLKCDSYTKDKSTYYKWSFTPPSNSAVGMDIEKIQPAKYGTGVALISDYGDFMNPKMEDSLNQVLFKYEKLTGVEIAILTVPSLQDEDPADFATKTFNRWGIGKKGANNGILILTSMGDRKYWIAVGYGMEDIFPDALAKRFGENCLVPNFKEGEYEKGFNELIERMKEEFGNIPIERKKELDKKYDQIAKENVKNFFIGAGEIALLLLVMGLIGYLIYASAKKRKELRDRINELSKNIANFDAAVANQIKISDPIFNDDEVLSNLKGASEALLKTKIRGEKRVQEISTLLMTYIAELQDIKRIEREIVKIKQSVISLSKQLSGYEATPTQMKEVGQKAMDILNKLNFEKVNISEDSLNKYRETLTSLTKYYNRYNAMYQDLDKIKVNIEGFDKIKTDLLGKLNRAKEYTDKVTAEGYETGYKTTAGDIESLRNIITTIGGIYMTDMPQALELLHQYGKTAGGIETELGRPVAKYNDIVAAKQFVNKYEASIQSKVKEAGQWMERGYLKKSEFQKAEELAATYPQIKQAAGKDILKLSDELQKLLQKLENVVNIGATRKRDEDEEKERERRRREEEEERRRRKKREEEEEEERRRRRNSSSSYGSYGSSYDSGSSFGGGGGGFDFGGGSCGGGGAGGSW